MATGNDIGLSQPAASTITMRLATVTQNWNSTVRHQELLTLAGAESTLEIARVMASAPGSSEFGLVVRLADPVISSVGGAVNMRSSAANALVTVYQSTATDLLARVNQGVGNSTVADRWRVTAANSSAADYTPVRIVDSSGTGFLAPGLEYTDGSTTSTLAAPSLSYRNSSNDTMRVVGLGTPLPVQLVTVYPTLQSTTILVNIGTAGGSTALVSSVAAQSHKVYAFSVTSTVSLSSVAFISSAATERWGLLIGSQSSGVTGANLAVTPPGFLFKSVASEALGFSASSTGVYRVSISYFTEA